MTQEQAGFPPQQQEEMDDERLERTITTNLLALLRLTRAALANLAAELGPRGIRVDAVAPAFVFLPSQRDAGYVSGTVLGVTGGKPVF